MFSRILNILTSITGREKSGDEDSLYLAKKFITLIILNGVAIVLAFLTNYVLIKAAGVEIYGSYIYIFNLLYLLVAFSVPGTDTLLRKMNAVYSGSGKRAELKGILIYSIIVTFIASVVAAGISLLIAKRNIIADSQINNWYLFAFISLLIISLNQTGQASLQGLKKISAGFIPYRIIRPASISIIVLFYLLLHQQLTLNELAWFSTLSVLAALVATTFFHRHAFSNLYSNTVPRFEISIWNRMAVSFFTLNALFIVNSRVDIMILGEYGSNKEVGVYNIALRISEIVGYSLTLVNFIISPLIAQYFANGEKDRLQNLITRSSRLIMFISLPLAIIIILFSRPFMNFFDADLHNGHLALLILCAGQIVNVLCGSVGMILLMTGHQRYSILSIIVAVLLNVILNLLLIPSYGLTGTAIATAASMAAWNFIMYIFVLRKTRINTFALASLKKDSN